MTADECATTYLKLKWQGTTEYPYLFRLVEDVTVTIDACVEVVALGTWFSDSVVVGSRVCNSLHPLRPFEIATVQGLPTTRAECVEIL